MFHVEHYPRLPPRHSLGKFFHSARVLGATMCFIDTPPMHKTAHGRNRHHVYALETTGLLIVAATLLAITLVRYWYAIHWSLR